MKPLSVLFLSIFASSGVLAEDTKATPPPAVAKQPPPAEEPPAKARIATVQVLRVGEVPSDIAQRPVESKKHFGLGDVLLVKVDNLPLILKSVKTDNPLSFYLDGILMRGVDVYREPGLDDWVRVRLERNDVEGNKKAWVRLLGNPPGFKWTTSLAIGSQDAAAVATPMSVTIHLLQDAKSWLVFAFTVAVVMTTLLLGWRTPVLRDSGKARRDGRPATYSLARTQMALWFVGVLVAFLAIWAITGSTDAITASLLALMGIGSGTALGAAVVDSNKRAAAAREYAQMEIDERNKTAELADKQRALDDLRLSLASGFQQATATAVGEMEKAVQALKDQLQKLARDKAAKAPDAEVVASEGFVWDLLTDDNGYSLHRVQMAGWTIVLFIIFCGAVYHALAMPDFDTTLLALMGISAGTYLGFKIPEQQTPQQSQPPLSQAPSPRQLPPSPPAGDLTGTTAGTGTEGARPA